MEQARVRLEHMMDRDGPVDRWILDCQHGRWFFDRRAGAFPETKAAIIRDVLVPKHDESHGGACTRDLRDYYSPLGPGRADA